MKFLCLGYHDEQLWQSQPEQQRDALLEETFAYARVLQSKGHLIDDRALEGVASAAILRFEKGRVAVTDDPFAATEEQLGGLMVLEGADLNEAIQLMSKMPCMSMGGSIEIRPINEELK